MRLYKHIVLFVLFCFLPLVMLKQLSLLLYHCEEEHSLENAKISFTISKWLQSMLLPVCHTCTLYHHPRPQPLLG